MYKYEKRNQMPKKNLVKRVDVEYSQLDSIFQGATQRN